ncbi:MAG: OstA-like protein [Saprospiraceae bacterium]
MFCKPVVYYILLISVIGFFTDSPLLAQTKVWTKPPTNDLKNDTTNRKFTLHAEDNQIIDARVSPPIQYLNGNVKVFHSGTFMFCDTATIRGSILRMKHNVAMLQNDTIRLFADSMVYNADSLVAYLYGDIIMENGKKRLYTQKLKYHVGTKIASYDSNAMMVEDSSQLTSKKGVYYVQDKKIKFKENVRVTGTDFVLITDSLGYETETQTTYFLSPTRIKKDTVQLYAEDGWFDINDQKGDFIQNAQYVSGKSRALADTIHYDGLLDLVILSSNGKRSEYISEVDTVYAQKIKYDKKNEFYQLFGDAFYKSKSNEVNGEYVEYNKKIEKFKTLGRGTVSDPPMIITADSLDYSKMNKIGIADGQVIWRDTAANTTIYSDHVRYRGDDHFMLAYNNPGSRPYFTTQVDTTLLHMKADTLKSRRVILLIDSVSMDTIDYFVGFNKVRVYKDDLQMVCDSIIYNMKDSIFTLFTNPVVWSDTTQITGDTIHFYMKNGSMDRFEIKENGAVINSTDLEYFNQVKGRYMEGFFAKGKINAMKVDGDAEVIYYLQDSEKAYIGVNQSRSSYITFKMDQSKISDIFFYIDVKSKVLPMSTNHEAIKIKGFKWIKDGRPISVEDL